MVILGFYFLFLMMIFIYNVFTDKLEKRRFLLRLAVLSIPLAYLASQAGWIVAEMGRQPWVIQDLLAYHGCCISHFYHFRPGNILDVCRTFHSPADCRAEHNFQTNKNRI